MAALSPEEQLTRETYRKIAAHWAEKNSNPDHWRPEFEKFQTLLPYGRVIDLGCGSGKVAPLFSAHYYYIGVDVCEEMLAEARKRTPHSTFMQVDMYCLQSVFPQGFFDGFWAESCFLHIPKKNLEHVLTEVRTVVRPGGVGFVVLKEGEGEHLVRGVHQDDERFFAFYQAGEFAEALARNGFSVLEQGSHPCDTQTFLWYLARIKDKH